MWCLEASPAKTYPSREKAQVLTESEVGYGGKWRELSVKYVDSSSWRTHRALFDLDLPESSVTLPQWGMMRGGRCWSAPRRRSPPTDRLWIVGYAVRFRMRRGREDNREDVGAQLGSTDQHTASMSNAHGLRKPQPQGD